jgi:hypothetical protein
MTRYADPERCPDCLAPMPYGASRCPACGLSLEGPLAAQLFTTLSTADDLLAEIRSRSTLPAEAASTPAASAARPAGTPVEGGGLATLLPPAVAPPTPPPGPPPAPSTPHHGGLSGASVPKILLGLGALCLLIAALVFLAVAWSAMGVAGRTATLLGFTAVAGGLSTWSARRDLRAAAESLGVVALGLLTFDLFGARSAGWLGDISTPAFVVLLGTVVALVGVAAATAVRRTPVGALVGAEVFAALGVMSAAAGVVAADWFSFSAATTLVVVLTAAVAAAARVVRLDVMAAGSAAVAAVSWVALAGSSWDRALSNPSFRELWVELEVWPLLAATALVAALALVSRLPLGVRIGALAVAVLMLFGAALAPFTDESITGLTAAGAVVVLAGAVIAALLPQPWRRSFGVPVGVGLLWLAVPALVLASDALGRVTAAGRETWTAGVGDSFPARSVDDWTLAAWLLPLVLVAMTAALVGVARSFTWADRLVAPLLNLDVVLAATAATAILTAALYPVPMWLVLAALLVAGCGFVVTSLRSARPLPLGMGAGFLALALMLALHAEWLTLLTLVVLLAATLSVHLRWPRLEAAVAAGALVAAALGAVVWTVGSLTGAAAEWTATAALVALALLVLAGPYVDERTRLSGPATYARLGPEGGAFLTAFAVSAAGATGALTEARATWVAAYLTLAGVAVTAMALLRADRRSAGWLGGVLLVLASWVRLADLGVGGPEAYTLPAAVALLVVGLVHLHRNPTASTMVALSPGLGLALVPSLLWVLADPVALRSVLLGLACLALVVGGVRLHWSAPVVHGAVVGALLVVRLATPVADAVPRWALIGAAGILLVALGITWERRVRDARMLAGYVRSLR